MGEAGYRFEQQGQIMQDYANSIVNNTPEERLKRIIKSDLPF